MSEPAGNALLSVFDKTGIEAFAGGLHELDWNIYASGGTFRTITEAGVPATDVSELVGGSAILDHRVVTLSREIAAGLLANLDSKEDMEEMRRLGYPIIHLVCQDSYPLEKAIADPNSTPELVLEQIDIGGPNMLREAAKGNRIVLSVAEQRERVLEWLRAGKPDEAKFLRDLTDTARYEVARYTLLEAKYWNGTKISGHIAKKVAPTKYGENPDMGDAAFFADNRVNVDPLGLDRFAHVKGVERSFINKTDNDRLLQTATHIAAGFERNFDKVPAMAIGVKHGNACGAAVADTLGGAVETVLADAAERMIDGDSRAIFGGVVMVNGIITEEVAEAFLRHSITGDKDRLLDGIIGSDVTEGALDMLTRKKLRVVTNPALAGISEASLDKERRVRQVRGGWLEQPNYTFVQDFSAEYMEEYGEFTEQERRDLILAWAIGCTSNSNTMTIVNNGTLIGNGVGQQDRIGAAQLALSRTSIELPTFEDDGDWLKMIVRLSKKKLKDASLYSDSFLPFPDGAEVIAAAGIKNVLTSSSSVNDDKVLKAFADGGVRVITVPDIIGRGFFGH